MIGSVDLPPSLAPQVRRALGRAAPGGADIDERGWREKRDRLGDLLEPTLPTRLESRELRELIDVLSESGPSAESRMTPPEWSEEIGEIVSRLSSLS